MPLKTTLQVIDLKPNYAEAYTQRGIAYDKKGDYDKCHRGL